MYRAFAVHRELAVIVVLVGFACGTPARDEPVPAATRPAPRDASATTRAGPPIAWTVEARGRWQSAPEVAWADDRTLVVADEVGLRAFRDGKLQWSAPASRMEFVIAGDRVLSERSCGDGCGIALFDLATGEPRGTVLERLAVDGEGVIRDGHVIVMTTTGGAKQDLFDVTPAACGARTCVSRLGVVDDDDDPSRPRIGPLRDDIVIVTDAVIRVLDRRGKLKLSVPIAGDNRQARLASGGAIVRTDTHVAVLSLVGCKDPSGCPVLSRDVPFMGLAPIELPGGAIVFSDAFVGENIQLVERDGHGWVFKTRADGEAAGDTRFVYTVSVSQDAAGPVQLVALSRTTGDVEWRTELPKATAQVTSHARSRVLLRGRDLAVQVGPKVYVLGLPGPA